MKAQWPAIIFWVALAAMLAAGFAYWNSRPTAPTGHVEQTTIGSNKEAGPPDLSPSLSYPLPAPAEALPPVSTPKPLRKHKVWKRKPVNRFASRKGFCSRVPAMAYRVSAATITAYMQQAGYSSEQIAQVLACIGK